jgi:hypothetical protein
VLRLRHLDVEHQRRLDDLGHLHPDGLDRRRLGGLDHQLGAGLDGPYPG